MWVLPMLLGAVRAARACDDHYSVLKSPVQLSIILVICSRRTRAMRQGQLLSLGQQGCIVPATNSTALEKRQSAPLRRVGSIARTTARTGGLGYHIRGSISTAL